MNPRHALLALVLCPWLAACGYALAGRGSFLPADIKVIAVAPFESETADPKVAEVMRAAVIEELEARGRYKVVEENAEADAVLSGRIGAFQIVPITFGAEDRVNRSQVTVRAGATLKRHPSGELLYDNPGFNFRSEYEIQEEVEDFFDAEPEVVEELAREFSQSLVSAILENF